MTESKAAIVTGAGRRIGRAIALALSQHGWNVCVHCSGSRDDADETATQVAAAGMAACVVKADLADPGSAEQLMTACVEKLGNPSCLVNNASVFLEDQLATLDAAGWSHHLDVNLRAPVLLAQAFARRLPPPLKGHIINIVDQRVLRPTPEFFSYGVSKSGLWAATQMMAQALAPRIRVNAIGPGPVLPNIHQTGDEFQAEVDRTLLKARTPAEDIAAGVLFLIETESITGQLLTLDGGQHLQWRSSTDNRTENRHE